MKPEYEREYLQIGLKIAYYRKLYGLTQEQLAERVGRTPAYMGHVGTPNISKEMTLEFHLSVQAAKYAQYTSIANTSIDKPPMIPYNRYDIFNNLYL